MRTLFLLILFINLSFSKTVFVIDNFTFAPIEGAIINDSLKTDIHGRVDIDTSHKSFSFQKVGFKNLELSYEEIVKNRYRILLEPIDFETEEVVVSASRWESNRQKLPVKISNIEQSKVLIQNPQTAADLLGTSGDVFIQKSQQGGGSPMIRGFSTNRVMITVDGVRMNNAIFRSGNLHNVISIDPFAIERTEVVFGPGSVLYGSDAIGGVMNFYSRDPALKQENSNILGDLEANLRYSSASNERTISGAWDNSSEKFGQLIMVSFSDFDDLRMGSDGRDEYLRNQFQTTINGSDTVVRNSNPQVQRSSGYSQFNGLIKLTYDLSENWELKGSYMGSRTSDIPRYDRLIRFRDDQPRSSEWYYGPQIWNMLNFTAIYKKGNNLFDEFKLTIARQRFEESRNTRGFSEETLTERVENVEAYSANLDFFKEIGDNGSQLYYGAEMVYNDIASNARNINIINGLEEAAPTRYPNGSTWLSSAIYGNYQYSVSEKLSLFAGARANFITLKAPFNSEFFNFPFDEAEFSDFALNGSSGFAYRPTYNFQVNGNISTGFRAPNVDDIGKIFDSEPGSVIVPNPNLSSEFAYNFELGFEWNINDILKFDLTGFYTILNDALVRRDFTFLGQDSIIYDNELSQVQAIQNAARTTVYGVQTYIEAKLPYDFAISTRLNYQAGEEEMDDGTISNPRHAAPMFGKTVLKYSYEDLRIEFYAEYSDELTFDELAEEERGKPDIYATDSDGNPFSPSWYTLNLKGIYRFNKYLLLSFGIENITDQRYRPYSSGLVAPGINFIGSIKVNI